MEKVCATLCAVLANATGDLRLTVLNSLNVTVRATREEAKVRGSVPTNVAATCGAGVPFERKRKIRKQA